MPVDRTPRGTSTAGGHEERLRRAFERQAARYDTAGATTSRVDILAWVVARLPLSAGSRALDVAAGTGQLSCALAEAAARVLAVDLTAAMLARAARRRRERGLGNLDLCLARAEALPVAAAAFDLVACRLAVHHMAEPRAAVAEMARACAPGGCVALVDLIAPDDPDLAETYNRLERRRDPSHVRALPLAGLAGLLEGAGLADVRTEAREVEVDVERWLDVARPPADDAEHVRRRLRAELSGGAASGMRPFEAAGALKFRQTWAVALAAKA